MDECTVDGTSPVQPPHAAVPTLPPDRIELAIEAARVGALVAEVLDQLSQRSASGGLPSPEDCGLAMDFDTMASVGFALAAWAGALLEAAGQARPAEGASATGGATMTAPPGLVVPPGGLLLPPGVRRPDQQ